VVETGKTVPVGKLRTKSNKNEPQIMLVKYFHFKYVKKTSTVHGPNEAHIKLAAATHQLASTIIHNLHCLIIKIKNGQNIFKHPVT